MTSGWTSPKENLGLILSQGRFLWRIDIIVFEMARNLQWSDQVDAEYEKHRFDKLANKFTLLRIMSRKFLKIPK